MSSAPTPAHDPGDTIPVDFDSKILETSDEPGSIGRVENYHIQSCIGVGGMGVVFRAWDATLRRVVAVKFVRGGSSVAEADRRRFLREARAAAAVTHPNIVTIHTGDQIRRTPYLVMELVEGESLQAQISKGKRYQPVPLLQMVLQLCEGLQAAHDKGIIHRDIKPSNVLIDAGSGRAKISDFGLARLGEDQSWTSVDGAVVGTPAYMSPEQVNGGTVDARSDLFSLGCLIYAAVTGRSPFSGQRLVDSVSRIVAHTPTPLSESHPGVPVVISKIVSRLIEKNPDDRFQSAAEVADEIRQALVSLTRGSNLEMADTIRIARGTSKRRPGRIWIAASALAAVLAAIGMWQGIERGWFGPALATVPGGPGDSDEAAHDRMAQVAVASDGSGDAASLVEALSLVAPGGTITLLDDATYDGACVLGPEHNDVTIVADHGATLIASNQHNVLFLNEVSGVTIRGVEIVTTGTDQSAIVMLRCRGGRLEGLKITQQSAQQNSAILIEDCNPDVDAQPIVVTRCEINSLATGQCIWVTAEGTTTHNVVIAENRFTGPRTGTLAYLGGEQHEIRFQENVLDGGHVGLNLKLVGSASKDAPADVTICNNTFHDCVNWLGLMDTLTETTRADFFENLIVDCQGIEDWGNKITNAVGSWRFGANVRVNGPPSSLPVAIDNWVISMPVEFKSLTRGTPGYLQPSRPIVVSETDGADPEHVGALPAAETN